MVVPVQKLALQRPVERNMFSDIALHWASECILALAQRGLISGYPNGAFRPDGVVTRAEFAALMPKLFSQISDRQAPAVFHDIPAEHWASEAIAWVSGRGLFSGYEDSRFRPGQTISRVQVITVLTVGIEAAQGVDAIATQTPDLTAQSFSDADQIPAYAREAVASALDRKLLEPLSEPRPLRPNQAITRGEVAALLCRLLSVPAKDLIRSYPQLEQAQNRQATFQSLHQQEAGFNAEKLAFLDRGIRRSPFQAKIPEYTLHLKSDPQASAAVATPLAKSVAYPAPGDLLFPTEGALDFLSSDILSGCVCLSTLDKGELQTRWLGKDALSDRQLWSATKFVPLLNVIARANAAAPAVEIDRCQVRAVGTQQGYSFDELATGIVTYDNRIATSNSLAAMFKHFETPARLEEWTQQLTGNGQLSFQGRYGEAPFIEFPQLWDPKTQQVLLQAAGEKHKGQNLVSTYDLTRLLTMSGWHWQIPQSAAIPGIQGHSLTSFIQAMGADTARYVDVALETLGLTEYVRSPVIISKSGFGRSDQRDRTELTYSALVQFSLPRQGAPDPTATHQQYSLGFTLIAAKATGDANQEARYVDALMAAEVTEILRRTITKQL